MHVTQYGPLIPASSGAWQAAAVHSMQKNHFCPAVEKIIFARQLKKPFLSGICSVTMDFSYFLFAMIFNEMKCYSSLEGSRNCHLRILKMVNILYMGQQFSV